MPVPCCFSYCDFAIYSEIRDYGPFNFILCSRLPWSFGTFVVPIEFLNFVLFLQNWLIMILMWILLNHRSTLVGVDIFTILNLLIQDQNEYKDVHCLLILNIVLDVTRRVR